MSDRFSRIALSVLIALIALYVANPWLERYFLKTDQPRPIEARGDLAPSEKATVDLFRAISPSVLQVASKTAQGAGTGTGFIWDTVGHAVTNNHVVTGAQQVAVRLSTGDIVPATVVGTAPNYDLAVLRLDTTKTLPPPIPIGSSHDLAVGQAAYAIGNPYGLDQSLTTGVISALNRRLPTSGGRELADVIQTDAAINPGNSGGPLLDSAGRLIGVNTAIFSPSGANAGIGFAIPVDVVNRIVPQLIRDGRVPTPGIGILAAAEEEAMHAGIDGIIVARTLPGSPAQKAGLKGFEDTGGEGDVIVAVEGVKVRRLADLTRALETVKVGDTVTLDIVRSGAQLQLKVGVADIGQQ
ncbi:MAG: trypsin-like peptidase domain-containing protein [Hyphomicrobiales bacterium]